MQLEELSSLVGDDEDTADAEAGGALKLEAGAAQQSRAATTTDSSLQFTPAAAARELRRKRRRNTSMLRMARRGTMWNGSAAVPGVAPRQSLVGALLAPQVQRAPAAGRGARPPRARGRLDSIFTSYVPWWCQPLIRRA